MPTTDLRRPGEDCRAPTCLIPAQTGTATLAEALSTPGTSFDVHLVRGCPHGTPGPFLCGLPREEADGWVLRGGVTGPGIVQQPCTGCVEAAANDYPTLPIVDGVGASEFRIAIREEASRG